MRTKTIWRFSIDRHGLVMVGVVALMMITSASCAAGPNPAAGGAGRAGFFLGLWHGIILPVTFIISLFTEGVTIYEVRNVGNWYDFGFVLGAMVALGGGGAGAGRRG